LGVEHPIYFVFVFFGRALFPIEPRALCKDFNFYNTFFDKRRNLCARLKKKFKKITDGEEVEEFLRYFSKPTQTQVSSYERNTVRVKKVLLQLIKIRTIEMLLPLNKDYPLKCVRCSCPGFFHRNFCIHSLSILIQTNSIDLSLLPENNIRGRKPEER